MMRRKRIIWILAFLMVLLPALLYVTRNQWVAFALKQTVSSRSDGQIILSFKNIEVGVLSRTLTMYEPELRFKHVYFDKTMGTMLKNVSFQKLLLTNISIAGVLLHKQFLIDNLLLEKPAFILGKEKTILKKPASRSSHFDPARLIEVMQNHEVAQLRFAFLVHHTHISFGKIELNGKKGSDIYGSARYNFVIENMGTIRAAGDTLRPLTFDRLELTVRDFHRYSAPEKLNITLDSAFYSSRNRRLFLRGMHVDLLDKNRKNPPLASFHLRWASISGMESQKEKKRGKWLHLGEIKVLGGNVVLRPQHHAKKKKGAAALFRDLFSTYRFLSLDTVDIRHVHVYQLDKNGDTVLHVQRMNLAMQKLWADKGILKNPLSNLHFKSFLTSCSKVVFQSKDFPWKVNSGRWAYDSRRKEFTIEGLQVTSSCKNNSGADLQFRTRGLVVGNLSAGRLQRRNPQLLSLKLTQPILDIKDDTACKRSASFLVPDILKPLQLERLQIFEGQFRYLKTPGFVLGFNGIKFYADSLQGTLLRGAHAALHYDSLFFRASQSFFGIPERNEKLQTARVEWNHRRFKLSKVRFSRSDTLGYDSLRMRRLTFVGMQINPLLFRKTLLAWGAYLYKADFRSGRFDTVLSRISSVNTHWNHSVKLPFKTQIGYIHVQKSRFMMATRGPQKNFRISSRLELKLHGFKMGYDTAYLLSPPRHWQAVLKQTRVSQQNTTLRSQKISINSDSGTFFMQGIVLNKTADTGFRYRLRIPSLQLNTVHFKTFFLHDSLIFNTLSVDRPHFDIRFTDFVPDSLTKNVYRWHIIFDSLKFHRAYLHFILENHNRISTIQINNLNLQYHPLLYRSLFGPFKMQNLIKQWDFSVEKAIYFDKQQKLKVVADRIALQSAADRLYVKKITGTNFTPEMMDFGRRKVFSYFLISNMSFNHLMLTGGEKRFLHVEQWLVPSAWVNIINNDNKKQKRSLAFLNSNFFSRYSHVLDGIHIDSSLFKNVNISYQYDKMSKLVNIVQLAINTRDIQFGKPFLPGSSSALFGTMHINLNDRSIISGDSLYTFRMRDVTINLPQRKIRFDSITLVPRFSRADFFARVGYQTDRITLYGKNVVLDNFNPGDLLNGHFIHFGNLHLNNMSLRFERDLHYPRREVVKPMPIDLLNAIPYKFRFDSVNLRNSMLSYFEYEVKSKNPAIFFIDNFNLLAQNVTNHIMPGDSNLVLKFKGSGKLMKQADMDFTLVMPYFAPQRQWWFSAEAGRIDLTQFNPVLQNALGLSIISGKGSLQVPLITGNNISARGKVDFLYKKLKIRMYDRKKSQQSKRVWSPFANFMINGIVVKRNNPPFLGHPKQGIVYFERIPQKSFINYLWKSNLSGILSTIGFNNKQQRELKREDKKQSKAFGKSLPETKPHGADKQKKK